MSEQPDGLERLPKRKHTRLKSYDYSQPGAYFITVCTRNKAHLLGHIVGRGLAPAECSLTDIGAVVEKELLALPERFPNVSIDKYVIMPNHVHALIIFGDAAGGKPPPYAG